MKKPAHTSRTSREIYEYAFSSVPADKRKPADLLALILFGFTLSTSAVRVGIQVGNTMLFWEAIGICAAGNLILFLIALFWGVLGQKSGNTSGFMIKRLLGKPVSLLFSIFVILAMIGWMGINGEWLADILVEFFPWLRLPHSAATMLLIALGTSCSLYGWKSMEIASKILIPIILALALYIGFCTYGMYTGFDFMANYRQQEPAAFSSALTLVIGNYAMAAVTMPDLCRFAKSKRAVFGAAATYAVTLTVCNLGGILIAQWTGAHNLTYGVYLLGIMVPGLVCLSLCSYTTQTVNMYVGSLALQNVLKETAMGGNLSHKMAVLFMGGFAMMAGSMGAGRYLSEFSRFLALDAASLTGIAIVEVLIGRKLEKVKSSFSLVSWLISIAASLFIWSFKGIGTWMIPTAFISASVPYIVLRGRDWLAVKKYHRNGIG